MTRPDELFTADRVVLPTGSVEPGWVRTAGDRITAAGGATPLSASRHLAGTVVPGFVDVHCHGGGGSSFATGDAGHAVAAIATHRAHGTTSLVASLVSDTSEQLGVGRAGPRTSCATVSWPASTWKGRGSAPTTAGPTTPARSAHRTPARSPGSSTRVAVRCGW